jgi:phosphatidylserine decarboxylase
MGMRIEVVPFLFVSLAIGALIAMMGALLKVRKKRALLSGGIVFLILGCYMLVFFRDPPRTPPSDPDVVVSAADGKIANIVEVSRDDFEKLCRESGLDGVKVRKMGRLLQTDVVRISIFLSLVDVHVNRTPIAGTSEFLGYFPGKRHFTFLEKSSAENQHNAIYMHNERTACLIQQIVGPVARRVVYWPDHNQAVELEIGYPFGMMKFGSRLDMYFPKDDIVVKVQAGDRVVAGETIVARLTARTALPAPSTATAKDLADPEPSQAVAPPAIGMEAPEAEAKKE